MADQVEQQDIRGLDIDKTVKGFALINYVFKTDCMVSSTSADAIRWYQETSADMTTTSPHTNVNISPLSIFPTLEHSWTRNTSYPRKYGNEDFISMEDIKTADIDVLARTLLRLTRAVIKQVDTRIFNVLTEDLSPNLIQTFGTTDTGAGGDQWDAAAAAGDPVTDVLFALSKLATEGYDTSNVVMYLHPDDHKNLMAWLIGGKGSSVPAFHTAGDRAKLSAGTVMNFMGVRVKVSINVTTNNAVVFIPQKSCTWKSLQGTTAKKIIDPGIGTKIRVWEQGEAILTDPKSVVLITDLQT